MRAFSGDERLVGRWVVAYARSPYAILECGINWEGAPWSLSSPVWSRLTA